MTKHLNLNCYMGYGEHAQKTMKRLGITYELAVPQSIVDSWWFFNCENIPDPLPKHFKFIETDLKDLIGYGLSQEDVDKLNKKQ